ncbi:sugar transferase [Arthrobacter castelli]|uniref:sugar transferase n=1 Tax=Arthrobacter castelli TaxID=271431 RepID=UPI0006856E76|nr:sugar transferase [Arthrobacter castelli]
MPERTPNARSESTKRAFDVTVSFVLLVVTAPVIAGAVIVAAAETKHSGLFSQSRVGRHGELFQLLKIRTMRNTPLITTTVTTGADSRITRSGAVMRKLKIDELPQLINVLRGDMSLVGPRPDVPGFADTLDDADRRILSVRPGITGPATIAFRHEEQLLNVADDPERYNREVIWPEKVRLNCEYVDNHSLLSDIRFLSETLRSVLHADSQPANHK